MMNAGEEIFWKNARAVLRDIGISHLDPAHGAAVDVVRWCLLVRGRPTHHRQTFLEAESPALLAYLETLGTSGDAADWRTLEERIRLRAEILREEEMQPCAKPWLAAIWHCLPELAGIGQTILDGAAELKSVADFEAVAEPTDADAKAGDGGDDKGSAGKAGSAAKPKPSPRLALPVVAVVLTEAEMKALDLSGDADADAKNDTTPDGPDGTSAPKGPKMPGGPK
ncbi:hypothetical protein HFN49_04020 [Rhizobium leguminosarum]|uniref:hypothetical protein n=1 Tax=Rhizobium ruizarguesonis TaxID=2081791 RepID=UPI001A97D7E5|nr:hypothetical protein [Rhizobium ruizarguesonis]MBY5885364.1 hypothetical protein [Rhizobium leguminosarum]QSZ00861.1 hypothetical protein J3P73_24120 [Rhizobium ruizarguesonis]